MNENYPPSSGNVPPSGYGEAPPTGSVEAPPHAYHTPPPAAQPVYRPKKEPTQVSPIIILLLALIALVIGLIALGIGVMNSQPVDTDKDGYSDTVDVFPHNPSEWLDSDNDGVGNNADAYPNNAESSVRLVVESDTWIQKEDTGDDIFFYVPADADYLEWSFTSSYRIDFEIWNVFADEVYVDIDSSSSSDTIMISGLPGHPEQDGLMAGLWKIDYRNNRDYEVTIEMEIVLVY